MSSVVSNIAGLGENMLSLAELQARLGVVELRQNVQSAKRGGSVLSCGLVLGVTSLPVAFLGAAELLVSELGVKRGFALLGVAGAVFLLGACFVAVGRFWLRRRRLGFPLSAEELTRNLNWIRAVLRHSGRPSVREGHGLVPKEKG